MNNWIDRLERRYSRFAIPYLVNGLMVGQLAAGLIVLLINWQFSGFISLSRSAVLHGQIWRLITFLFQPVWLGGALGILNLVFYFWIGNSLTRAWGDFRMTLFIALGVLGAWISCFLAGGASPDGIFLSMMFAYTWMWPEQGVLLFGIIPFKMKYLGWYELFVWVAQRCMRDSNAMKSRKKNTTVRLPQRNCSCAVPKPILHRRGIETMGTARFIPRVRLRLL